MRVLELHGVQVTSLAFGDGGRLLVTSCGHQVAAWAWPSGDNLARHFVNDHYRSTRVAAAPSGRWWAWDGVGALRVASADAPNVPPVNLQKVRCPVFGPDGRVLYAIKRDGHRRDTCSISRWDAETRVALPPLHLPVPPPAVRGWDVLTLCPDGTRLASTSTVFLPGGGYGCRILVWDAATGAPVAEMSRASGPGEALAFSADNRHLASLDGRLVRVWDYPTQKVAATLRGVGRHFTGMAWTPDGRQLLTVGNDKTVRVWDAGTWAERQVLTFGIGKLQSVAVAPDGLTAAAGGHSGQVVAWDLEV